LQSTLARVPQYPFIYSLWDTDYIPVKISEWSIVTVPYMGEIDPKPQPTALSNIQLQRSSFHLLGSDCRNASSLHFTST